MHATGRINRRMPVSKTGGGAERPPRTRRPRRESPARAGQELLRSHRRWCAAQDTASRLGAIVVVGKANLAQSQFNPLKGTQ